MLSENYYTMHLRLNSSHPYDRYEFKLISQFRAYATGVRVRERSTATSSLSISMLTVLSSGGTLAPTSTLLQKFPKQSFS